jgi:hypothetical protein
LPVGATLAFRATAGTASARAYLPVEPAGAQVVAIDGHGRPAILRREHGSGRIVFCTYPLEHLAARTPRVNPESTWRLYSALADEAGVSRPVRVADPRVLVGLVRSRGSRTAVLVNTSRDTVVVEPLLEDDVQLAAAPGALTLAPADVAVLPLRGGRGDDGSTETLAVASAERGDARD